MQEEEGQGGGEGGEEGGGGEGGQGGELHAGALLVLALPAPVCLPYLWLGKREGTRGGSVFFAWLCLSSSWCSLLWRVCAGCCCGFGSVMMEGCREPLKTTKKLVTSLDLLPLAPPSHSLYTYAHTPHRQPAATAAAAAAAKGAAAAPSAEGCLVGVLLLPLLPAPFLAASPPSPPSLVS